jgi:hypothetical protein
MSYEYSIHLIIIVRYYIILLRIEFFFRLHGLPFCAPSSTPARPNRSPPPEICPSRCAPACRFVHRLAARSGRLAGLRPAQPSEKTKGLPRIFIAWFLPELLRLAGLPGRVRLSRFHLPCHIEDSNDPSAVSVARRSPSPVPAPLRVPGSSGVGTFPPSSTFLSPLEVPVLSKEEAKLAGSSGFARSGDPSNRWFISSWW